MSRTEFLVVISKRFLLPIFFLIGIYWATKLIVSIPIQPLATLFLCLGLLYVIIRFINTTFGLLKTWILKHLTSKQISILRRFISLFDVLIVIGFILLTSQHWQKAGSSGLFVPFFLVSIHLIDYFSDRK